MMKTVNVSIVVVVVLSVVLFTYIVGSDADILDGFEPES